jgi:hypothetical protein
MQVMLDTAVSAATARGDSPSQLAALLLGVVQGAVAQQLERLCAARTSAAMSGGERVFSL